MHVIFVLNKNIITIFSRAFAEKLNSRNLGNFDAQSCNCTNGHIFVLSLSQASMSSLLQYKLPSMLQQHQSIKLLVIDSMAALFRAEFTSAQLVHRAHMLRSFGASFTN